jgi:predicted ATPase
LLTLTGPGGVGKTRLGLRLAHDVGAHFADGAVFVLLAPVTDPTLVASTLAYAVGVHEAAGRSVTDRLQRDLQDKDLLLVLDNFEQVVNAAPVIADLLAACPRVKLLVTSRIPLRVSGEHVYAVSPLAIPDSGTTVTADEHAASAIRLFVERANAADHRFTLTEANASTVAEICRRLDGLPLAIELAAARVAVLPPAALLLRLEKRLPLLTSGPRDAPPRLRTMRDAIAWSYDLLAPPEQALFRRLAIFVGGFTLDAAEAFAATCSIATDETFEVIAALVEQSLLRQEEGPNGQPRYGMLETIREFGLECLAERGETAAAREARAKPTLGTSWRPWNTCTSLSWGLSMPGN